MFKVEIFTKDRPLLHFVSLSVHKQKNCFGNSYSPMSEAITNINHCKIFWTRDRNHGNSDTLSRMLTKDDLIADGTKHKQLPPQFFFAYKTKSCSQFL